MLMNANAAQHSTVQYNKNEKRNTLTHTTWTGLFKRTAVFHLFVRRAVFLFILLRLTWNRDSQSDRINLNKMNPNKLAWITLALSETYNDKRKNECQRYKKNDDKTRNEITKPFVPCPTKFNFDSGYFTNKLFAKNECTESPFIPILSTCFILARYFCSDFYSCYFLCSSSSSPSSEWNIYDSVESSTVSFDWVNRQANRMNERKMKQ